MHDCIWRSRQRTEFNTFLKIEPTEMSNFFPKGFLSPLDSPVRPCKHFQVSLPPQASSNMYFCKTLTHVSSQFCFKIPMKVTLCYLLPPTHSCHHLYPDHSQIPCRSYPHHSAKNAVCKNINDFILTKTTGFIFLNYFALGPLMMFLHSLMIKLLQRGFSWSSYPLITFLHLLFFAFSNLSCHQDSPINLLYIYSFLKKTLQMSSSTQSFMN